MGKKDDLGLLGEPTFSRKNKRRILLSSVFLGNCFIEKVNTCSEIFVLHKEKIAQLLE